MNIPVELKYTKDHEWISIDGDIATVGITDFAQSELNLYNRFMAFWGKFVLKSILNLNTFVKNFLQSYAAATTVLLRM